ncbi:MAG: ABC transporter permease subunit [Pyrinomonadaceae bacterium]
MPVGNTGFLPRILAIAKNAFREAVRDRILYNLIVFALLITASAVFLGDLTAGQEARVIVNLGLTAIRVFGTFIAIFVGISLVSKEIEKRTVYAVFSKPVGRGEFIIGKYLGLCATLLFNVAVMGLGVTLALVFVDGGRFLAPVWAAILLIFLELAITTAVAIMFSSFSTPSLSALLTFMIFIIAHFSSSIRDLAQEVGSPAAKIVSDAVYHILPNFSHFTFSTEAANQLSPTVEMLAGAAAYSLVYSTILISVTVIIFSHRNFK